MYENLKIAFFKNKVYRNILRFLFVHGNSRFIEGWTVLTETIVLGAIHLHPCVDIFYGMNFDKKWTFLDHLPTSSCKRSLLTQHDTHLGRLSIVISKKLKI